ncbi:MAG TPA: fumarylacetoacetate hydrolase family protein [Chloroflexota bacterium]|nr:fumarylacetoacetate hydrolase family protein [Chloroflexota bacterium]
MKFLTFATSSGRDRLGVLISDEQVLDLTGCGGPGMQSMLDLIDAGDAGLRTARLHVERVSRGDRRLSSRLRRLCDLRLRSPIPQPRNNLICVGLNYRSHLVQNARAFAQRLEFPTRPIFHTKPASAVIGPEDPIVCDESVTLKLDYEVELAVVIGKRGASINSNDAFDHVFGYTIANDVVSRDAQFRASRFSFDNGLDGWCPLGPVVVDRESVPDPAALTVEVFVNGGLRQRESVSHMLFSLPIIMSELSSVQTLEPGDIIATGTPEGSGYQLRPARFLRPGDIVACRIEGIGILSNPVVAPLETVV